MSTTIPTFLYRRIAIGRILGLSPSTTANALGVPLPLVKSHLPEILDRLKDAADNIPSWVKEQDPLEPFDWGRWKEWKGEGGKECAEVELIASPEVAIQAENAKNQHIPGGISRPSDTRSDVAPTI